MQLFNSHGYLILSTIISIIYYTLNFHQKLKSAKIFARFNSLYHELAKFSCYRRATLYNGVNYLNDLKCAVLKIHYCGIYKQCAQVA